MDFIEIGTSNYSTLTQAVAGHPDGDVYAWNYLPCKCPQNIRGIAIDMVQNYLDELPDLPNVAKVCRAVSESRSVQVMHYVPKKAVRHWANIFAKCGNQIGWAVLERAKACASLGKPKDLVRDLRWLGLARLLKKKLVQVCSLPALLKEHAVESIGTLKIDAEGQDCVILRGLLHACEKHPQWYPKMIAFESNGMSDFFFGKGTEDRMREALADANYDVVFCSDWDTVAIRREM